MHEGPEDHPDVLSLKMERQGDVCRTRLQEQDLLNREVAKSFTLVLEQALFIGPTEHTELKANHAPQGLRSMAQPRAGSGRARPKR